MLHQAGYWAQHTTDWASLAPSCYDHIDDLVVRYLPSVWEAWVQPQARSFQFNVKIKLVVFQWLPCWVPGMTAQMLGLVGPVSLYHIWMRYACYATCISVWQIQPWDTPWVLLRQWSSISVPYLDEISLLCDFYLGVADMALRHTLVFAETSSIQGNKYLLLSMLMGELSAWRTDIVGLRVLVHCTCNPKVCFFLFLACQVSQQHTKHILGKIFCCHFEREDAYQFCRHTLS